jgi:hypothetical protein
MYLFLTIQNDSSLKIKQVFWILIEEKDVFLLYTDDQWVVFKKKNDLQIYEMDSSILKIKISCSFQSFNNKTNE